METTTDNSLYHHHHHRHPHTSSESTSLSLPVIAGPDRGTAVKESQLEGANFRERNTSLRCSVCILSDILAAYHTRTGAFPSDSCLKIVQFIVVEYPENEFAEFSGVSHQEYEQILDFFENCNSSVIQKARLTYLRQKSIIIVEMPSQVHEVPFMTLGSTLQAFANTLPGTQDRISPAVYLNFDLVNHEIDAVPDLTVNITDIATSPAGQSLLLVIGECAFSQSNDSVLQKLDNEIKSIPEVLMVILVEMDEHHPYHSPAHTSAAWQMLRDIPAQDFVTFLSAREDPRSIDEPIRVAGHTWFHLASVKFKVWVRGSVDSKPINVYSNDDSLVAHGTLFPTNSKHMDDINTAIQSGMNLLHARVTALLPSIVPTPQALAGSPHIVDLDRTWDTLVRGLLSAIEHTAFTRYCHWRKRS